jgi:hypothetical protein
MCHWVTVVVVVGIMVFWDVVFVGIMVFWDVTVCHWVITACHFEGKRLPSSSRVERSEEKEPEIKSNKNKLMCVLHFWSAVFYD